MPVVSNISSCESRQAALGGCIGMEASRRKGVACVHTRFREGWGHLTVLKTKQWPKIIISAANAVHGRLLERPQVGASVVKVRLPVGDS